MASVPITNDPAWTQDPSPASEYAIDASNAQKEEQRKRLVAWGMRIVNCGALVLLSPLLLCCHDISGVCVHPGLCVMMAATGVLSLGATQFSLKFSKISEFFVALYVLLFAAVWFLFEVSQIHPINKVQDLLRQNFGCERLKACQGTQSTS